MTASILDEIRGIGDKRKIALLKKFHSIDNIKNASLEALEEVDGINQSVAKTIFDYFHGGDKKTDDDKSSNWRWKKHIKEEICFM